jgi:uncharacterized protein
MSDVRDNPSRHRFELEVDGHVAFTTYKIEGSIITFIHTEVPKELGGRGVGTGLARGALDAVRARGLKVIAKCPFIAAFMKKHKEFDDLKAGA